MDAHLRQKDTFINIKTWFGFFLLKKKEFLKNWVENWVKKC